MTHTMMSLTEQERLMVQVGPIRMEGANDYLTPGFNVTRLSGWSGRPQGKRISAPLSDTDGELPTIINYGARSVTVEGYFYSDSMFEVGNAIDRLTSLSGRQKTTVREFGRTLWCGTKIVQTDVERYGSTGIVDFTVQMIAENPRKFGRSRSFAQNSAVKFFHDGNTSASPVFTLVGSATGGFDIVMATEQGGSEIQFRDAINGTYNVDTGSMAVYKQGNPVPVGYAFGWGPRRVFNGSGSWMSVRVYGGSLTIGGTIVDTYM